MWLVGGEFLFESGVDGDFASKLVEIALCCCEVCFCNGYTSCEVVLQGSDVLQLLHGICLVE